MATKHTKDLANKLSQKVSDQAAVITKAAALNQSKAFEIVGILQKDALSNIDATASIPFVTQQRADVAYTVTRGAAAQLLKNSGRYSSAMVEEIIKSTPEHVFAELEMQMADKIDAIVIGSMRKAVTLHQGKLRSDREARNQITRSNDGELHRKTELLDPVPTVFTGKEGE